MGRTVARAMQNCAAIAPTDDALLSPSLLLIASSRRWKSAVHAAARELNGARVATCAAREAIIRLAGTAERYSHVLVQPGCADGWLTELVGLSAAAGCSPTEMFLLAPPGLPPPRVGVIRSADRHSVRQALSPASMRSATSERTTAAECAFSTRSSSLMRSPTKR